MYRRSEHMEASYIYIVDLTGKRLKSFKPHMASIIDVVMDPLGEFVGTASIDDTSFTHALHR